MSDVTEDYLRIAAKRLGELVQAQAETNAKLDRITELLTEHQGSTMAVIERLRETLTNHRLVS